MPREIILIEIRFTLITPYREFFKHFTRLEGYAWIRWVFWDPNPQIPGIFDFIYPEKVSDKKSTGSSIQRSVDFLWEIAQKKIPKKTWIYKNLKGSVPITIPKNLDF